jgi:hypothetical protein
MKIPDNENAPHRAVIFIQAEVHELLPSGECSGRKIFDIKQFPIYLDGMDRNIAIRKLNELLAEVKEKCKASQIS